MPTLIVENVPVEIYERLQKRAAGQQRSLPEETLHLLQQALQENDNPAPRNPEFIGSEESSVPCDLPRYGGASDENGEGICHGSEEPST